MLVSGIIHTTSSTATKYLAQVKVFRDVGVTYRKARSFFEAKCWPFPEGPDAFSGPESTLETCLECAASE